VLSKFAHDSAVSNETDVYPSSGRAVAAIFLLVQAQKTSGGDDWASAEGAAKVKFQFGLVLVIIARHY
jgi:hypothetical protein